MATQIDAEIAVAVKSLIQKLNSNKGSSYSNVSFQPDSLASDQTDGLELDIFPDYPVKRSQAQVFDKDQPAQSCKRLRYCRLSPLSVPDPATTVPSANMS